MVYTPDMEFEWDDSKNQRNAEKHFITFEEATTIFAGEVLTVADERYDYGEPRFLSLGELRIGEAVVIVVVHTERQKRVRLISARKASRKERRRYYDHVHRGTP